MRPTDLFSAMHLLKWAVLALCIHLAQSRYLYKRQADVTVEISVEETTAAETTVAETTVEETTVAETTPAETTVEETTVAETTAAETTVAETTVEETTAAETTAAETTVAETTVEETTAAETTVAETTAAETTAEETTVAETTAAETTVEETTAAETTVAETTTTEEGAVTAVPYGDELITPKASYVDEPYAPKGGKSSGYSGGEQGSGSISQGGYSGKVRVEPSGYRRKRGNEYVDENLIPPTPPPGEEEYVPEGEETPAPADQYYGQDTGPAVEPGGYRRKKRQSEYGDENVIPTTISYGDVYAPATEETYAPIDQGYAASEAPPVKPGGYRKKRHNEYGDESVTPSTPVTPGYGGEESFTEETPATAGQGYGCNGRPPVYPGGYRRKRQNEYGDENVTPSTPPGGYGGEESYTEQTPATVDQGYECNEGGAPVEPGGYRRKKRQSEYGDENVIPTTSSYGDVYAPATEETYAPIDQGYAASEAPPVKPGGYRKKRQSEYGDENVIPTTSSYGDVYAPATEETYAPIDQGYAASEAPPVKPGGYRKKRQSEYGDENITPSTPATPGGYGGEESFTEETPATAGQEYGGYGGPPVQPGGYRKKRQSEYGDENITPSTPATGGYGGEEYFTEETPAAAGQEYGGYGGPPVQPGGYRKKRHNEYGDENITPSTPATPGGYGGEEYFTEETPATAGQKYGGYGKPPVQPGGYRKKRHNEYGDENITPSTPGAYGGEESFTEETPATAGQEYGGYGGPPVQPGGYRKKRHNEYGDENITPSTPGAYGGEETFTEETPATAGQEYGGYGGPPVQPGGYRKKRQSEYGDENITPSTPATPGGYGGEESFTEETPATAGQEYGGYGGPPVQPGGYRKKRHNEYGDENITPSTPGGYGGEESFTEETPATAGQGYGCNGRPPVYPGGYRRKRQNEYGDENVTPSTPPGGYGGEESYTEQTPATVDQGYGCNEGGPPVEPGGYRKKRSNA